MILALADPARDPTQVGTWVLIALGIGVSTVLIVNGILSIVRHFWPRESADIRPNPLVVKPHTEYTPLADHLRLADKVDGHRAEAMSAIKAVDDARRLSVSKAYDAMREAQAEGRHDLRDEMNKVHERLNNHTAILGEIRGTLENLKKTPLEK